MYFFNLCLVYLFLFCISYSSWPRALPRFLSLTTNSYEQNHVWRWFLYFVYFVSCFGILYFIVSLTQDVACYFVFTTNYFYQATWQNIFFYLFSTPWIRLTSIWQFVMIFDKFGAKLDCLVAVHLYMHSYLCFVFSSQFGSMSLGPGHWANSSGWECSRFSCCVSCICVVTNQDPNVKKVGIVFVFWWFVKPNSLGPIWDNIVVAFAFVFVFCIGDYSREGPESCWFQCILNFVF